MYDTTTGLDFPPDFEYGASVHFTSISLFQHFNSYVQRRSGTTPTVTNNFGFTFSAPTLAISSHILSHTFHSATAHKWRIVGGRHASHCQDRILILNSAIWAKRTPTARVSEESFLRHRHLLIAEGTERHDRPAGLRPLHQRQMTNDTRVADALPQTATWNSGLIHDITIPWENKQRRPNSMSIARSTKKAIQYTNDCVIERYRPT